MVNDYHVQSDKAMDKDMGMPTPTVTDKEIFSYKEGHRYIAITHHSTSSHMPGEYNWGWVDKKTGNILRGGWKSPDPVPKSVTPVNVFDDDYGMRGCAWTGPMYASELKKLGLAV
jgi:hypothetical protein